MIAVAHFQSFWAGKQGCLPSSNKTRFLFCCTKLLPAEDSCFAVFDESRHQTPAHGINYESPAALRRQGFGVAMIVIWRERTATEGQHLIRECRWLMHLHASTLDKYRQLLYFSQHGQIGGRQ